MRPTTLPIHIVGSAELLARHLADHDMPGRRSKTAITLLRRHRARQNAPLPSPLPVKVRARELKMATIRREIRRRGGEIGIEGTYGTADLHITDQRERLALVNAEGWREYGSAPARWSRLSYLWGPNDAGSGAWAVRVPGSVTTVAAALEWLTPAEVKKAQEKGLRVRRQGDVYAIETTRRFDGHGADNLPASHRWNATTRYLTHQPEDGRRHRPVRLPWPSRFVRQTAYEMGRTGRRGDAD